MYMIAPIPKQNCIKICTMNNAIQLAEQVITLTGTINPVKQIYRMEITSGPTVKM